LSPEEAGKEKKKFYLFFSQDYFLKEFLIYGCHLSCSLNSKNTNITKGNLTDDFDERTIIAGSRIFSLQDLTDDYDGVTK